LALPRSFEQRAEPVRAWRNRGLNNRLKRNVCRDSLRHVNCSVAMALRRPGAARLGSRSLCLSRFLSRSEFMSRRLVRSCVVIFGLIGTALAPPAAWAQCSKGGGSPGGPQTGGRTGASSTPLRTPQSRQPQLPMQLRPGMNTPTSISRNLQPNLLLLQANRQMQLDMQQAMWQQRRAQEQLKQHLLTLAAQAPEANLRTALKHSDPFVRWAASIEINRRHRFQQSVAAANLRATGTTTGEQPFLYGISVR
jgi:hypothetical protein